VQDVTSTCTAAAAPNVVMCESPAAGVPVNPGTQVILYVLPVNGQFPVPNVAGDTTTAASNALGSYTLNIKQITTTKCSNTVAKGLVVGTNPATGAKVTVNTSIGLITSSGGCPTTVPWMTGRLKTTAQRIGTAAGFVIVENPAPSSLCTVAKVDQVVHQSVQRGLNAPYGSTLFLEYCATAGPTGSSGVTGATGITGATGATTTTTVTNPGIGNGNGNGNGNG